jgi:four helix bundle protein
LTIGMTPQELRERTQQFKLRIIRFCRTLPGTPEGQELGRQLIRSGMGVSGNYRSAQRARSRAEFAARLGLALDEADESDGWLRDACELGLGDPVERRALKREAEELCAILGRSCQTARRPRRRPDRPDRPDKPDGPDGLDKPDNPTNPIDPISPILRLDNPLPRSPDDQIT